MKKPVIKLSAEETNRQVDNALKGMDEFRVQMKKEEKENIAFRWDKISKLFRVIKQAEKEGGGDFIEIRENQNEEMELVFISGGKEKILMIR